MNIRKIHHVAYRCNDTKQTIDFYSDVLDMKLVLAISEDKAPSTNDPDPYMHVFLDAGAGNILAFFELPESPPMGKDPNTPAWVQHIAFEVEDEYALVRAMEKIKGRGIDVLGPTDHGIFKSIYFFDPNGHRLELATPAGPAKDIARLNAVANEMIDEWSRTKKVVRHAAWMHEKEFAKV